VTEIKPIKKICVVGGGTAGISVASVLKKTFPEKEIVMIKGRSIPTVGVGESTLGEINNFLQLLNIQDKDFMKACDASYKQSIRFEDFYQKGDGGFHYPFGEPYYDETIHQNSWYFLKFLKPNLSVQDYADSMFPHMALINEGRITNKKVFPTFNFTKDTAYHFDAVKFANWIEKNIFLPLGGKTIIEDIVKIEREEDGSIKKLLMDTENKIQADLYIDCTGFKSLLLGETLKEPFESYEHLLPNNSAWATKQSYKNKKQELKGYTNCKAVENGWIWNIPLWSRMGTGYVYSDKYIDDNKALEQFKKHIGQDDLEFKKIKMRIGIHKRLWVKNVCAIGLSAGFIEPLESNGLLTIHTFLIKLIPILKKNIVSEFTKEHYNWSNQRMFRNFAEFVAMHYYLSNRVDTEYWQDIQKRKINMKFESEIQRAMTDKMERGSWTSTGGFPCIATGMNWFPTTLEETMYYNRNSNLDFWKNEFKSTEVHLNNRKQHFKKIAQKEPYLFDFLQKTIYGNETTK
jgi:flavin-dependent dehydrogenase